MGLVDRSPRRFQWLKSSGAALSSLRVSLTLPRFGGAFSRSRKWTLSLGYTSCCEGLVVTAYRVVRLECRLEDNTFFEQRHCLKRTRHRDLRKRTLPLGQH